MALDKDGSPDIMDAEKRDEFGGPAAQSVDTEGVTVVKLEDELKQSFIDYAMSVIVDRALPDVRDGLKPVHRRVLFDMYDLKVRSSGATKKSARIVGDVIGRFHPHGDAAVYDTIVRLTQWFSMRAPLVFGQGNFGNIDGDGPAAMRYTEVKMTEIAEAMLTDIDKETVDTYPNYDATEEIPEVLPTRFPNLLVNGSQGIAVGMATNIPPHNLGEVIDGTIALLDDPEIDLPRLMQYIKGPDFPTGGFIVGTAGVFDAYATGRGRVVMRARTHTEVDKSGRKSIVIDEIPYMESKSAIVKQIAELVRDKKIDGIAEVNDLSDKDHLVRVVVDLKRDAFEEAVLNNLFEKTNLQANFAVNMIALVNGQPRQLGLLQILREFIDFRREVVTRRTVYLLRQDRKAAFDNEGLIVAKDNINKIVDIITSSENTEEAKRNLMNEPWDGALVSSLMTLDDSGQNVCLPQGIDPRAGLHDGKYYLSQSQAEKILSLQLSRLTKLSSEKIQEEYQALIKNILGYLEILNSTERLKEVIREELLEVKERYADKRRSDFIEVFEKISKGDLIPRADVVVTLSQQGYVKYQDISAFEVQRRGGKGKAAAKMKEDDYIAKVLVSNTHDILLCSTSKGRLFCTKVYDLPTSENRTWRGRPIQNYFEIEEGEKITSLVAIDEDKFNEEEFIFLATELGFVKKIRLKSIKNHIQRCDGRPLNLIDLRDGDSLVGSALCLGDDDIYLFTQNYRAIHFCDYYPESGESEEDAAEAEGVETAETEDSTEGDGVLDRHFGSGVRPSGRGSGTIRGMKLLGDDKVVSLIDVPLDGRADHYCIVLSKKGIGKKMRLEDFTLRNRGGQGMSAMNAGRIETTGTMSGASLVQDGDEYLIVTDGGTLIRCPVDESLRALSRQAAGVKLMRVADDESIIELKTIPERVAIASQEAQNARRQDKKDREALLDQLNGRSADKDASEQDISAEDSASADENTNAEDL